MMRGIDPRDQVRNRQELLKDTSLTMASLKNMTMQQIIETFKNARSDREKARAKKAILSKLLSMFRGLLGKSVSSAQAAAISAAGNDIRSSSAGDAAKVK